MEKIADTVEDIFDEVDKAAEGLKEALPEGRLKETVAFVEKFAEHTSDSADKVSDLMDKVFFFSFYNTIFMKLIVVIMCNINFYIVWFN